MKTLKASGLLMIVAAATLLGAVTAGAAPTVTQTITFANYPAGTPATAIHVPGVTFSVPNGDSTTDGHWLRVNALGSSEPTTLVMDLARPASAISFPYLTFGRCDPYPNPIHHIQLFLHGVQVDTQTVNSCDFGTYARTLNFDQLRISAGNIAASEGFQIESITITYAVTKDDCKGAGWQHLGYANQGQCVAATNH